MELREVAAMDTDVRAACVQRLIRMSFLEEVSLELVLNKKDG